MQVESIYQTDLNASKDFLVNKEAKEIELSVSSSHLSHA